MSEAPSTQTWWTVNGPSPWGPVMSMSEDRVGCGLGLVAVLGDLDAAGLAAAADQHLRLDDARVADLLGRLDGGLDVMGDLAARHRDAVAREELLALIFEKVQSGA